jgi:hypothetical protein
VISSLPKLRLDSKNSFEEVVKHLDSLPPPPTDDPASELLRMVTVFQREVGALVQGEEAYERLIQRCRPAYFRLKRDIRGTAPRFVPFLRNEDPRDFDADFCAELELPGETEAKEEEEVLPEVMYLDDVRKHIEK